MVSSNPDLKPIEYLWGDVKKYIGQKKPSNTEKLGAAVCDAWNQISVKWCQYLDSMPRRGCAEVNKIITKVIQLLGDFFTFLATFLV